MDVTLLAATSFVVIGRSAYDRNEPAGPLFEAADVLPNQLRDPTTATTRSLA
jgi:hypothetical protein